MKSSSEERRELQRLYLNSIALALALPFQFARLVARTWKHSPRAAVILVAAVVSTFYGALCVFVGENIKGGILVALGVVVFIKGYSKARQAAPEAPRLP